MQQIIILGNLGGDPQMRYMPNGTAVTNFSVAENQRYTDRNSGEIVETTTWFRVSVWDKQAEACNQWLAKGRQVLVTGVLQPDKQTGGPRLWTDNDGNVRASFEVKALRVDFVGGRGENGDDYGAESPETADDIPF